MTDTAVKKSAESVKMPENGKKKTSILAGHCLRLPCGSQRGAERDRLEKYVVLRLVYGSRFSNLGKYIWQAHFAVAVLFWRTAYCGGGFWYSAFAGGYAGACDSQKRQEKENCENFRACLYVDSHFCGDGADL